MELQKAEEVHRDLLLKDRDERNKIAKDLHSLRRYGFDRVAKHEAVGEVPSMIAHRCLPTPVIARSESFSLYPWSSFFQKYM